MTTKAKAAEHSGLDDGLKAYRVRLEAWQSELDDPVFLVERLRYLLIHPTPNLSSTRETEVTT
jgi:hypothetical protein